MTDQTAQEPTMEEILASIRRIISEDDAPAEPSQAAAAAASPEPAAPEPSALPQTFEPEPAAFSEEEDVLELTDRYEADAAESIGDLDVTPAAPEPAPAAPPRSESVFASPDRLAQGDGSPAAESNYNPLVGESAAASAASAFAGLASSLRKTEPAEPPTATGPTLDELVRSLLRPMLKEWLDTNLPAIVEAQVRKEVERIARTAG